MAHFHFSLRGLVAPPAAPGALWRRSLEELPANEEVQHCKGPGWFDSSWDLVRGLEVHEGLPGDAQLHEWLAAWLRDDRVAAVKPRPARALAVSQRPTADDPGAGDGFEIEGLALV